MFEVGGEVEVAPGECPEGVDPAAWLSRRLADLGVSASMTGPTQLSVRGNPFGSVPKWLSPLVDRGEVEWRSGATLVLRYRFTFASTLVAAPLGGIFAGLLPVPAMGLRAWPFTLIRIAGGLVGTIPASTMVARLIDARMERLARGSAARAADETDFEEDDPPPASKPASSGFWVLLSVVLAIGVGGLCWVVWPGLLEEIRNAWPF